MITIIPGPFSKTSGGFNTSGLASQGMTLLKKESVKIGSADALLIYVSQSAYGTDFRKWVLIFGDEKESTLVAAAFPEQFESELSASLKKVILSVKAHEGAEVDFFEGFTFRVEEAGDLKFANKMGTTLILSRNGVFPQRETGTPAILVGSSITEGWDVPKDKGAFARQRLHQTATLKQLEILAEKEIKLNGLDGRLIDAVGRHKDSGERIFIRQCVLFTKAGYYIFQAMVGFDEKDAYDSVFNEIMDSFRRLQDD